jgi:hypothetical protein
MEMRLRAALQLAAAPHFQSSQAMRKSSTLCVSAIGLALAMVPFKASAQGVGIYIGPGYPGYAYPAYTGYYGGYPAYGYAYPSYGYAYPNYGYGYGGRYYGGYWGQGRRVARRVNRRWDRWD